MLVHITLRENLLNNSEQLTSAIEMIQRKTGLRIKNEKRLARYGILTGDIEPDQLESLRNFAEVEHVAQDERRYAAVIA